MTLTPEQLFARARQLHVAPPSRDAQRALITTYLRQHPLPPRPSRWARWRWAVAGSAAGVAGFVGMAAAAQGTMPGDLLYPVKIHVTETIQSAVAVSPQAQANVAAQQLQQRLDEAEQLADEQRFKESQRAQLEQGVAASAAAIQAHMKTLKKTDGQPAALKVSEDISETISKHETSLQQIANDHPDQRESVERFVAQIKHEREQLLEDHDEDVVNVDEDNGERDEKPTVDQPDGEHPDGGGD